VNLDADSTAGSSPFLTYEPFYGLSEKPFSLASDPAFFYKSASHRSTFDALDAGIRRREGLIVLSGEIGTGKTTLCRAVLSQLDRKTFSTFVPDPFVTREDLLKMLLIGFGVASVADVNGGRLKGASRQDLSYPLYEFLDSLVPLQAFAVLVIDEAQNLSLGVMEEIRILAELEKRQKLLQVVLVGQPELRDNLRLPQMRQVEQRVTVRCELAPLAFGDVIEYVNHRLAVATARPDGVAFTGGALEAVCLASGGVPRLINLVCDRALQRGFDARLKTIDRDTVTAAVRDLDLDEQRGAADLAPIADMLPLPFETEPDAAAPAAPAMAAFHAEQPRNVNATPPPTPAPQPTTGMAAFEPEGAPAPASPAVNPLAEFDSEPKNTAGTIEPVRTQSTPPSRGLWWALQRALGLGTAVLGIAIGAGVLDTRAAFNHLAPNTAPGSPGAPTRDAAEAATMLPVPDAWTAVLIDGRAHEADTYAVVAATLHDRTAANGVVAELVGAGHRAHWAEVRTDGDAQQQVFVSGYGTLEDALALVTRLRQRPSTAGAWLFQPPGAARRPDPQASASRR
jgi:type II secretory pathway predicted ATPase ExeA